MDVEQRLKELKNSVERARQEHARAEVARDSAQQMRDSALSKLKEEFDIDSAESGAELLKTLRGSLEEALEALSAELEK